GRADAEDGAEDEAEQEVQDRVRRRRLGRALRGVEERDVRELNAADDVGLPASLEERGVQVAVRLDGLLELNVLPRLLLQVEHRALLALELLAERLLRRLRGQVLRLHARDRAPDLPLEQLPLLADLRLHLLELGGRREEETGELGLVRLEPRQVGLQRLDERRLEHDRKRLVVPLLDELVLRLELDPLRLRARQAAREVGQAVDVRVPLRLVAHHHVVLAPEAVERRLARVHLLAHAGDLLVEVLPRLARQLELRLEGPADVLVRVRVRDRLGEVGIARRDADLDQPRVRDRLHLEVQEVAVDDARRHALDRRRLRRPAPRAVAGRLAEPPDQAEQGVHA